jgi:hypothetical protein
MEFSLDGSVVDMTTIGVGLAAMFLRPLRRKLNKHPNCFSMRDCVVDFLNGSTIVPFLLLVMSVMSTRLLHEALQTNKLSMGIAGVIGFIFIARELLHMPDVDA